MVMKLTMVLYGFERSIVLNGPKLRFSLSKTFHYGYKRFHIKHVSFKPLNSVANCSNINRLQCLSFINKRTNKKTSQKSEEKHTQPLDTPQSPLSLLPRATNNTCFPINFSVISIMIEWLLQKQIKRIKREIYRFSFEHNIFMFFSFVRLLAARSCNGFLRAFFRV